MRWRVVECVGIVNTFLIGELRIVADQDDGMRLGNRREVYLRWIILYHSRMSNIRRPFSNRFGYQAPEAEIVVREDAPSSVREGLLMLGQSAELEFGTMRNLLCQVLLVPPNHNNWSSGNIEREVFFLIDDAPWFKVYDFAERLYSEIGSRDFTRGNGQNQFESQLNQLFREKGVGWEMQSGVLVVRGSEAFALATGHATDVMLERGAPTAANEIHEALRDISRRPRADATGAIQHAMAALECVARKTDGSTDNLGQIINRLQLPEPLGVCLYKLWGFASQQGRHLQEGGNPSFEAAELVVTVASAVSVFLLRRHDS